MPISRRTLPLLLTPYLALAACVVDATDTDDRTVALERHPGPSVLVLDGTSVATVSDATQSGGEISVTIGTSMAKPALDWLNGFLDAAHVRKNGELVMADQDMSVKHFREALLTEMKLTALDARRGPGADAAVELVFRPAAVIPAPDADAPPPPAPETLWIMGAVRLSIDGLDSSQITKIDSLRFKQDVQENPVAHLQIRVPAAAAQPYIAWLEASKRSDPSVRKQGRFTMFAADSSPVRATVPIRLNGVRIQGVARDDAAANVVVELYVEQITLAQG